jgi:hypothetical protein
VNETALKETTVNETALKETTVNETALKEIVDSSSRAPVTRIVVVKESAVKGSDHDFAPITSRGSPNAATPVHVAVAVPIGNTHTLELSAHVCSKPANQPS